MADSFPRLAKIDNPIADDWWLCELVDRETQRMVRITVGQPALLAGDANGDWYCPLSFDYYATGIKCFMGVSSLEALVKAVRFIMDCEREFKWVTPRAQEQGTQDLETTAEPELAPGKPREYPPLTSIDEPVLDDRWSYALPDGSKRVSQIVIGRPRPLPDESEWSCPVFFEHLTQGIERIHGVGPVDTLRNAVNFIITRLDWFSFVSARSCPPGQRSQP